MNRANDNVATPRYKLQVGKIQLATCKLVTLLIQDFFALETYRV